jgi:phosphodiesterase/alkaline phosphatase D-like protein
MSKSSNRKDIDESYADYIDDDSSMMTDTTEISEMTDTSMSRGDFDTKTSAKMQTQKNKQTSQQTKRGNQSDH